MLVHLSFLLMLSGLTGVSSITTISKASVKVDSFISIPCLYDPKFKTNVKYLCEGEEWPICTIVAKTNEVISERFRINDDVSHNVFTVRIRFYEHLLNRKGVYWCAVEIINAKDVKKFFYLSLASGHLELHVDNQEVTASPGDYVTIKCYYENIGQSKWCRLGGFCVTGIFGTLDGTHVTIDYSEPGVFTVTMGRVRTEDGGWYFCAKGSLQMPVHVNIEQRPSTKVTQFTSPTSTAQGFFSTSASAAETSVSAAETSVSAGATSVSPDKTPESAAPRRLLVYSLAVSITVVLCAVTAGVIIAICSKVKRREQTRSSSTEADDEVEYSEVTYTRKASAKTVSAAECNQEVIYSAVVTKLR